MQALHTIMLLSVWGWAGNSLTASDKISRGKGSFDGHINGGLVMKELKALWSNIGTVKRAAYL